MNAKVNDAGLSRTLITVSGIVLLLFVAWAIVSPTNFTEIAKSTSGSIVSNFRWYYIGIVSIFLYACLGLIVSPWGKIRIGKDTDRPEFTMLSWVSMLFAAGMGIGLVFWSIAEPMWHFSGNPYIGEGEALTAAAADSAMLLTLFHWGFHPWAIYGIVGLAMGYFTHRKGLPLNISSTLQPILGDKGVNGMWGGLANGLAIFSTVGGLTTSLGLGVLQISYGLDTLFGIPSSKLVQGALVVGISALAILSVMTGLKKGILFLSRLNIGLAAIMVIAMLVLGPTIYLLGLFVQLLGEYIVNVFSLGSNTFANYPEQQWPNWWTTFYWAWWISWSPFVGSFIARISRGRTIREFIIGVLLIPTLLSLIWLTVMGGTAINIELLAENPGEAGILAATKEGSERAMFATFAAMNIGVALEYLLSLVGLSLVVIFFITSCDSGTLVLSMLTSRGNLDPPKSLRLFWGVLVGGVALVLLLTGGLSAIQTAAIVAALPFSVVMLLMMVGLFRSLANEPPIK